MLGSITATHGTPHDYDRHVPMILLNAGVKAGKHAQRVSPADIAPTLARLLRITMKNTDGKAITVK
jgi:phosphoglycerol transferase MdoB-like AlkP superfamily enzyme